MHRSVSKSSVPTANYCQTFSISLVKTDINTRYQPRAPLKWAKSGFQAAFPTYPPLFIFLQLGWTQWSVEQKEKKRGETEKEKKMLLSVFPLQRHDLHDKPLKPKGPAFSGLN